MPEPAQTISAVPSSDAPVSPGSPDQVGENVKRITARDIKKLPVVIGGGNRGRYQKTQGAGTVAGHPEKIGIGILITETSGTGDRNIGDAAIGWSNDGKWLTATDRYGGNRSLSRFCTVLLGHWLQGQQQKVKQYQDLLQHVPGGRVIY